jgi:YHS domain-containing protein
MEHEQQQGMELMGHGAEQKEETGYAKQVTIDSYTVAFYVQTAAAHKAGMMKMSKGKADEGKLKEFDKYSHHVSVSLIDGKTGSSVEAKAASVTVLDPAGKKETKKLRWMPGMKHYGALFNLKKQGPYEISAEFQVGDAKNQAMITYELKGKEMTLMKKDPVCNMMVDENKAAATYEYKGEKYYFCMKSCKEKFEKEPEKYLKK